MSNWWPHHDQDEIDAVVQVLKSGRTNYWTGEQGVEFEKEFAAYTRTKHALAVSSGTAALELAYATIPAVPFGEIIVPARTFMATASAAVLAGFRPVIADIDAESLCVSMDTIRARVTTRTRAVVVVHWGGLVCPDIMEIAEFCAGLNIKLIEDCAHAHGAWGAGKRGDIGCFSMCVGKIMSTGGEGGMVVTNNEYTAARMAARRDHGRYQMAGSRESADLSSFKYTVEEFGSNARMTEMQAAIGRVQLKKLDDWIGRRQKIMRMYDEVLGQKVYRDGHVGYLYNPRFTEADRLKLLTSVPHARQGGCPNIGREPAFIKRGWVYDCPVADEVGRHVIGLPVYPTMTDADVRDVAAQVMAVL